MSFQLVGQGTLNGTQLGADYVNAMEIARAGYAAAEFAHAGVSAPASKTTFGLN